MKQVLLWLWQLPQHLLALILIWLSGATETLQPQAGVVYWLYSRRPEKQADRLGGAEREGEG